MPLSSLSAALIAALVGFGGTVALIVQAGQALGGTPDQITSAVTALCLGIALPGALLSFRLRMPVVLAWSTPGAALLAASTLHAGWAEATGAFMAAALMMIILGLVPALGRLAARIPAAVAAAMLAGVLLPFCMSLFRAFQSDALLAGLVLIVFVVARQRAPTFALLIVLVVAVAAVVLGGNFTAPHDGDLFGSLVPVMPVFDPAVIISLGLPLFLVTLVSQNLPGFVVLAQAGYTAPTRPVLTLTGLASLLLAPMGAHAVNLAAITAAICTGPDAHPDPRRRWVTGIAYAGFYVLLALFSAPLVDLFMGLPRDTIQIITGVALLGPLTGSIAGMLSNPDDREVAVMTFAATASGVTLFGIGSAFWGLVTGFLVLAARRLLARRRGVVRGSA
ncbi:benzoate/H(+) symporter BenE family transporter [Tistrella mobilis]|uniref:Benzoate transporter subfamily n=1 Tax=Tistrella mobilis (strain KA081020-065) TaxID=1110502 RepID=I3TMJ3_TISMK|nr:benzoate/H(+) symporter BenE family transporter [Tistrella mobilis]AFK53981.1 benzoate transporter subfamily [Tistrella mobilis KA081020-065]